MKKFYRLIVAICAVALFAATTPGYAQPGWTEDVSNPIFGEGTTPGVPKAYYPNVVYDASSFGGAYTYKMWYGTSGHKTGLAYSNDGIIWTDHGVVMTNGYHAQVIYDANGFGGSVYYKMWYWDSNNLYNIGAVRYTESTDGITWTNDQPSQNAATGVPFIAASGWNNGSYGPSTILYNATATNTGTNPFDYSYAMYFIGNPAGNGMTGLAYSSDGIKWNGYDSDSDGNADPVLVGSESWAAYAEGWTILQNAPNDYEMWYSGGVGASNHGIGHATSTDGLVWTKDASNPIFYKNDGIAWRDSRTYTPSVIKDGSVYKMWFSGKDVANGNYSLGYAILTPTPVTNIETPTLASGSTCGNYDVDISVQDFNNVGAISLELNYDINKLDYVSFTPNAAISSALLTEYIPGQLRISWISNTGVTLNDDEVLLSLNFDLLPSVSGIATNLTWSTVQGDCEYAAPGTNGVTYPSTFNDLSWTIPVRPVKNTDTHLEYCKIQDAIDDALTLDDHTITVAAGTYIGNLIVDKRLELLAVNAAPASTITGTGGTAISIQANGVEINGFKITNPGGSNAIVSNGFSGLKVRNNIITGIGNNMTTGNTHSIYISSNTGVVANVTIEDNTFSDIHGGENVPAISNGSASAINIADTQADFDVTGLLIQRNEITNVNASIVPWLSGNLGGKGAYGILLSVGASGSGQIVNPQILDNEISYLEGNWAHAIGLEGDTPGADILNNAISYLTDYKTPSDAVAVLLEDNASASSVLINENSFTNLNVGVWNKEAVTVDATCNWWGTNTVSGVAAQVNGLVTYEPWLSDGTDVGDPGFVPGGTCTGAANLYVNDAILDGDDTYTTAVGDDANPGTADAPFLTITKAVNTAVEGTQIWVDAGIFQEQVSIGKTVDITGVDRTKTIVTAPATMTSVTWNGAHPIVYAYGNANTINISKIAIDGNGGRSINWFVGMLYYDANGTFDNNSITGIHDSPTFTGAQMGHAYYSAQAGSLTQTLFVTNNLIDDYQKGGIYIKSAGTTATVSGNTVTGQNVPNVTAQNGICFLVGSTGTIENNIVTNNIWNKVEHPHNWTASGILLYQATATVSVNTLSGNEIGLSAYQATGSTYGINTFSDNKIHVWPDVPADINSGNIYDKYVLNATNLPEVVFGNIQYAIDEATAGDVLNASAGTFIENVNIHTSVTVNGNGQANTTVIPSFSGTIPGAGSSLPPGSSNIFLVEADNVTIQNLTVDGNNPGLTSGSLSNGVDVDARNGIITNHMLGTYDNLNVNHVTAQNIFQRAIYNSTGTIFNFSYNVVTNVAGESTSIAMMNWAGAGSFTSNIISYSTDGIVSNNSTGTSYTGNNISNSGSGIHSDNNTTVGDLIYGNIVTNCDYGIFIFAPFVVSQVYENTVTDCEVGLAAFRSNGTSAPQTQFYSNTVNVPTSGTGAYFSTNGLGWGSLDCSVLFENNFIIGGLNSFLLESDAGYNLDVDANSNSVTGNSSGISAALAGTQSLDFECNWWGTDDGNLIAPLIPGDVDYIYWLEDGTDNSTNPGFQPVPGSCTGAPDLTGTFNYYNSGSTSLSDVTVELWKGGNKVYPVTGTVTTNSSGTYTFANVLPDTYEVHATTSKAIGGINSTDAAQVNYWGVTPSTIATVRWLAGDVTGVDYKVNSNDAQRIQNHFLTMGNPDPPFTCPPWSFWAVGETLNANPVSPNYPIYPNVTIPAVGTTATKNFYGLVSGDFNRSFTPAAKGLASETLTLNYGEVLEVGSTEFELPLYAGIDMKVGAISLILHVPAELLEVQDVYLGNDPDASLLYSVNGDELRISWQSLTSVSLQAGDPMLTLKLGLNGPAGDEGIKLSLAADPLNELANDNFDVIDNAVLVVDVIHTMTLGMGDFGYSDELALASHPNPFQQSTTFVYSLPINGKVTLEVYDLLGNKAKTVVDEAQNIGEHQMKFDANILKPGVYMAILKVQNSETVLTRTIKIISKQ